MRRLVDFLPLSNRERPPVRPFFDAPDRAEASLDTLVPANANTPYDMKELILKVADEGDFFEIQADFAKNILTGFIRLEGSTVGVVANQPTVLAGCLDIDSSRKAARFVRFCDAFEIPILTFVDVPGFMPGTDQEYRRDHQARGEAALRLRRGDGAEGDGHHPQGLRRGLRRDELEAPARRLQLRLADGGDRGDGGEGGGGDPLPRRARRPARRSPPGPATTRPASPIRSWRPSAASSTR